MRRKKEVRGNRARMMNKQTPLRASSFCTCRAGSLDSCRHQVLDAFLLTLVLGLQRTANQAEAGARFKLGLEVSRQILRPQMAWHGTARHGSRPLSYAEEIKTLLDRVECSVSAPKKPSRTGLHAWCSELSSLTSSRKVARSCCSCSASEPVRLGHGHWSAGKSMTLPSFSVVLDPKKRKMMQFQLLVLSSQQGYPGRARVK